MQRDKATHDVFPNLKVKRAEIICVVAAPEIFKQMNIKTQNIVICDRQSQDKTDNIKETKTN